MNTSQDIEMNKPYLVKVPDNQKQWFRENYDTIKNEVDEAESIDYPMLENNIFGINERFIGWDSDRNGLVDDFLDNYIMHKEKTCFILDCIVCALEDCKDFDYFEMAHNLTLIIDSIDSAIKKYENEYDDFVIKNTADTNNEISADFLVSKGFSEAVRWFDYKWKQYRVYYKIEGYDCDILISPAPQTVGDMASEEQVDNFSDIEVLENHHYGDWHVFVNSFDNHLTTLNTCSELIELMRICKCPLVGT